MTRRRVVVVVGASLAGLTVCEQLRRGGHDGPITLVGDETHRPYDRPPLSKELLAGTKTVEDIALVTVERLAELELDLRLGTAATGVDLDRMTVALARSGDLPFDDLVIATGASARSLPGVDGLGGVHVLRTIEDAVAIRDQVERVQHIVVVGGGFIGAEIASVAAVLGREVAILDPEPFEPVPYVWSDQFGKRIQCFGSVLAGDQLVVVDGEIGPDRFVVVAGRGERLVGVVALDGGRAIMPYRRLLAARASWQDALAA